MGAVIGPPGEAVEELYNPYHRCASRAGPSQRGAVFAPLKHQDYYAQGGSSELSCMRRTSSFRINCPLLPWAPPSCRYCGQFRPFPYLALFSSYHTCFDLASARGRDPTVCALAGLKTHLVSLCSLRKRKVPIYSTSPFVAEN